ACARLIPTRRTCASTGRLRERQHLARSSLSALDRCPAHCPHTRTEHGWAERVEFGPCVRRTGALLFHEALSAPPCSSCRQLRHQIFADARPAERADGEADGAAHRFIQIGQALVEVDVPAAFAADERLLRRDRGGRACVRTNTAIETEVVD